jgi:phosphatidylserine decarboxylase
MPLTRYGIREWSAMALIAIALGAAGWWFIHPAVAYVCFTLWIILALFFRDPVRSIPKNLPDGAMLAPSDGTVSAVINVDHHPATEGPAKIVRIFMSVLNVHVNRMPCACDVMDIVYTEGKFLNAQTEESSQVNENNLIILTMNDGRSMGVKQISGMIARRIVCAARPGEHYDQAQKFGMVKFGSTTEVILPDPATVDVHVQPGDKVKGGLTHVATIPPRPGT